MGIDRTARIDPEAQIGADVEIGPYVIIRGKVRVGDGTRIEPFAVLEGKVEIGPSCVIGHHAVIGAPPQDVAFRGEESGIVIGEGTVLREFVTVHRATGEGRVTHIGKSCFIMAYCHIAHNCFVGNGVTMANGASLAGYVTVEDWATLSGFVGVHQFVRIGKLAMIGGLSKVVMDIPPYVLADGHPARIFGLNRVGMRRRGIPQKKRESIAQVYRFLFRSGLPLRRAMEEIREKGFDQEVVEEILTFLLQTRRGITRWVREEACDFEDTPSGW
uniref:Acyl-ACP--UDP-N-acetylglucosamine O-acyltransferase n=1 Tax=Candidatus Caldatribacterium californiense TaxID=1454726 RepID=A0A7V3YG05_9BACT